MFKIFFSCLCLLMFAQNSFGQSLRMLSMGNVSYAIIDEDNDLSPYNFDGNPAWFYNDEKTSWLKIIPSSSNEWGTYKKLYTPNRQNNYGITFRGVKTLGTDGTFLGETSYLYETRRGVKSSLKYDPYFGGAFFFNDTSSGNFRYDGPNVRFLYGLEVLPGLFGGASFDYCIMNGLKDIYTRSETHLREVGGNVGFAYQFSDKFVLAADYELSDYLEKIEAKSEDLLDVENYYFRGETFSIKKRSSSVSDKIRRTYNKTGLQVYSLPLRSLEIAAAASFRSDVELTLIPYVKDNESYAEFEEGNSKFYTYNAKTSIRYFATEKLILGVHAEFNKRKSWSKNSDKNLLLWEWDISGVTAGVGTSYKLLNNALVTAEYNLVSSNGDSSKYIDSRFTTTKSIDHHIRLGAEYQIMPGSFLRGGFNYSMIENDFIFGGKDVKYTRATLGAAFNIFNTVTLDVYTSYSFLKPSSGSVQRDWLESVVSLKLLNL
ncbi:MAG: hypothetical protein K8H86_08125 [Ignavibacteriaceae bacterium]|nr:hypothetical protein [Ignavibacteriaceae bacterium]